MAIAKPFILSVILLAVIGLIPVQAQDQEELRRARHHYNLGLRYYRAGKMEQAIKELYASLSLREIHYMTQLLLARALISAQRHREAAETLRGIEVSQRHTVLVQKLLGRSLYEVNKLRAASQALNYALALARKPDAELHYILGLVNLRRGEIDDAVREAKLALAVKPRLHKARKLLSDAYLAGGHTEQAARELKAYLTNVTNKDRTTELCDRLAALKVLAAAKSSLAVKGLVIKPRILRMPKARYTTEGHRHLVEGLVRVEALFGSDGVVQHVVLTNGLGFGLDEEAISVARKIEFIPGRLDDKPISIWMGVSISFSILDRYEIETEEQGKGKMIARTP